MPQGSTLTLAQPSVRRCHLRPGGDAAPGPSYVTVQVMQLLLALLVALFTVGCSCQRAGAPAPASSSSAGAATSGAAASPATSSAAAVAVSAKANPGGVAKLTRPAEPLNVILLVMDAMRADMPWAGYPREIAPNLTKLEKQSVSYSRAYAVSSYTAKSVAAILTGQYPSSLVRTGYFFTRYPESNLFFPELLQQAGVHTVGTHAHMYMRRGNGMDQGFDDWQVVEGITFDSKTDNHVTSHKVTELAIRQLEAVPDNRLFFIYVHYMDPHDVYVRHKEAPDWGHKARDLYDQEIFYSDLWAGRLLEHCRKQPWWNKTAVIVTGDHGEAFGEHSRYRHAFELWEMLVRVPMFFYLPGVTPRRIDTPRSHIDLAPTVLELMGVRQPPQQLRGQSLVPELYGAEAEPRPVLLDLPADSNNFQRRALVQGDYKVLAFEKDFRIDVYNVAEDPEEKRNLKQVEPEKYDQMVALYRRVWDAIPKVQPFGGNELKGGGRANGPSK
jgi:choline-sulfatase